MKITKNLKKYLYDFPYYKFDYKEHTENNSPGVNKMFLEAVANTSHFQLYSFKTEFKKMINEIIKVFGAWK